MKKFFITWLWALLAVPLLAENITFSETYYMLKRGDVWNLTISGAENISVNLRCERTGKISRITPVNGTYQIKTDNDGFYTLLIKDPAGKELKSHEFAAVSRIPDLVFWDCPVGQRYVTDRQIWPDKDGQDWLHRHVSNLRWAPGLKGRPADLAAMTQKYAERLKEFDGILIDEFYMVKDFYPYQLDVVSPAIIAAAKQQPHKKLYAWMTTPDPDCTVINEAIKAAVDLVLVEIYIGNFMGYDAISGEWDLAVKSGWADKAIVGLGIGRDWITTGKEAFNQIREVKKRIPESRGIGFFGDGSNAIVMRGIDEGIRKYFIMPVVMYQPNGKTVSNSGSMEARQLEVICQDGSKVVINSLPVGKTVTLDKAIDRIPAS